MPRFRPQLLDSLRQLTPEIVRRDLLAGIIVGIVALPLAIAFGIASGVTPREGLITAIIAGAIIAGLGGTRVQIGGPTGAFVVLVASIIERFGLEGLLVATLMAGVILVLAGLVKAGALIRYIPLPVTVGFTSGIAVVIAAGQIGDALGMRVANLPAAFLPKMEVLIQQAASIDPLAFGLTAVTLIVLVYWPRVSQRVPSPFVALLIVTSAVAFWGLSVETIGSRFGALPTGIPMPHLPSVSLGQLSELFGPACTIALLGAIESLLSAVVADGMTGTRHRANTELVAQGIANIASPLFGGIPATGAIARTATNVRNGGTTPIAGLVHAATLLTILVFAGGLAGHIPLAVLAAILLVVAWKMAEWHRFLRLLKGGRQDAIVLLSTFGFTILADLTVGIGVGMAVAAFLFLKRMTGATNLRTGLEEDEDDPAAVIRRALLPPGVMLIEVRGPLFFGGAEQLRSHLEALPHPPRAILLDLDGGLGLDATATGILHDFASQTAGRQAQVIFITRDPKTALTLRRDGLAHAYSVERALGRIKEPIEAAALEPPSGTI